MLHVGARASWGYLPDSCYAARTVFRGSFNDPQTNDHHHRRTIRRGPAWTVREASEWEKSPMSPFTAALVACGYMAAVRSQSGSGSNASAGADETTSGEQRDRRGASAPRADYSPGRTPCVAAQIADTGAGR